jgi:hypothetical protein
LISGLQTKFAIHPPDTSSAVETSYRFVGLDRLDQRDVFVMKSVFGQLLAQ